MLSNVQGLQQLQYLLSDNVQQQIELDRGEVAGHGHCQTEELAEEQFGRTEVIDNTLNPDFVRKFVLDFFFEEKQNLRFDVFSEDKKQPIRILSPPSLHPSGVSVEPPTLCLSLESLSIALRRLPGSDVLHVGGDHRLFRQQAGEDALMCRASSWQLAALKSYNYIPHGSLSSTSLLHQNKRYLVK
ncbi:hypothetical protein F2P81_013211 [Scophthalmus maximus]|uniref:C2 domain-containing protein n=1 Tax=Scophthalmus maximus TaxID=52904 RepID=A0A6A4SN67_SCOMX|nr:hypothetical protein F2P81_013211 [Scophthalmus maximus]